MKGALSRGKERGGLDVPRRKVRLSSHCVRSREIIGARRFSSPFILNSNIWSRKKVYPLSLLHLQRHIFAQMDAFGFPTLFMRIQT